jgi:C-terminal processing protease CtpA/Prc
MQAPRKRSTRFFSFLRLQLTAAVLLAASTVQLSAQMTPEQRLFDFQAVASLYAKRYGPANWKLQSIGVNIFELKPWADRVRAARSDIEYFEIMSRFVASFRDGHTGYSIPSRFLADLGIYVDIYDGKVLIEQIVRSRLPQSTYPFAVGDELVSLDGKPVEELITELAAQQSYSNPRTTRRAAADAITFRRQSEYPRAIELPAESTIVVRRASGDLETYTVPWTKTGEPLTSVGPTPTPVFTTKVDRKPSASAYDPLQLLNDLRNWSVPADRYLGRKRVIETEDGEPVERSYVTGWGVRNPYFNLPPGFQLRLGRLAADPFYSGVYQSGENRIGYLRIPGFSPSLPTQTILGILDAEIAFFRANTDGLIVDVSRNTGGGCIGLDYAARLIPNRFWFFGEQLRPTQSLILSFEISLANARAVNADSWVIATYQAILTELLASQRENRAITGPIPACPSAAIPSFFRPPTFENEPLTAPNGQVLAYEKPIVFLVDEFSVSFGDIFPAMMQDNNRGPIVGMRTAGWGGSISGWPAGFFAEATSTNTNSLVVRRQDIVSPDMPTAPFIENIGVIPDIELDFMTRENLLTRGGPFVAALTRIMNEEIAKRK